MSVQKNKIDIEDCEAESSEKKHSIAIVDTEIGISNLAEDSDVPVAEDSDIPVAEAPQQNDHIDKRLVDPIEYRVQQVHNSLTLEAKPAWFLAAVFNASFYQANSSEDLDSLDTENLFTHYLNNGLAADVSPSPAIDLEYVRNSMRLQGLFSESEQRPVMEQWLKHGFDTTPGHAWFNNHAYLEYNPDVVGTASNPYFHFAIHGIYENRASCEQIKAHINVVHKHFSTSNVDMELLFSSVPNGFSEAFLKLETQQVLRNIFMPDLYRAQIEANEQTTDDALYSHFLLFGGENRYRPTALFHDRYYRNCLASYEPNFKETDELQEFSSLSDKYIISCKTIGTLFAVFPLVF